MTPGPLLSAAAFAVIAAMGGCSAAPPTIVIDNWHNVPLAQSNCKSATTFLNSNHDLIAQVGCDGVTSCPEMSKRRIACVLSDKNTGGIYEYVSALQTSFATSLECKGVKLVVHQNTDKVEPAVAKIPDAARWEFQIDFVPAQVRQPWSVGNTKRGSFFSGTGSPDETAQAICRIVNGAAAKVSGP